MSLFFDIVKHAVQYGASYIHLSAGSFPSARSDRGIFKLDFPIMGKNDMADAALECLGQDKYELFLKTWDIDTAMLFDNRVRIRVNAFKQINGISIIMRVIKDEIPDMEKLRLPKEISRILSMKDGLVLVSGSTGSGKTTTLTAIVNELNKTKKLHIITIEDPIEYVHTSKECMINQREVGSDCVSYASALRAALREDPDIILVGEMRDLESISIALTAAETGHLVLSTLHTNGAAKTIDRLIDVFPDSQQQQIRMQISMSLKAVISQKLLEKKNGSGRIAAFEVMFVNNAISNLIRDNKTANINQVIQTGASEGMKIMEKSIDELLVDGIISKQIASEYSSEFSKDGLRLNLFK